MLRSSNCVLTGKTSMEYSKLNECPLDPGKQHLAEHLCMGATLLEDHLQYVKTCSSPALIQVIN